MVRTKQVRPVHRIPVPAHSRRRGSDWQRHTRALACRLLRARHPGKRFQQSALQAILVAVAETPHVFGRV